MRPGTRVVCVDDSIKGDMVMFVINHMPGWVRNGAKYTVRMLDGHDGIVDGVLLEEVRNPEVYVAVIGRVIEPRFATWRFRELEEAEAGEEVEEDVMAPAEEVENKSKKHLIFTA